eukprot:TRINITY_DN56628_c0_g1_i1.p1 TRINITY_DN56628_c0_g1~~TRINITY_DN56628_c0_g1_i1.p1  ORF type:complete len:103 (-),score=1.33 TRINITY_DN56628_c0_g1_i1:432-710(-)
MNESVMKHVSNPCVLFAPRLLSSAYNATCMLRSDIQHRLQNASKFARFFTRGNRAQHTAIDEPSASHKILWLGHVRSDLRGRCAIWSWYENE